MARRKLCTTLYLEPEQVVRLSALSVKTLTPQAELIRRAIDAYLNLADTGKYPAQDFEVVSADEFVPVAEAPKPKPRWGSQPRVRILCVETGEEDFLTNFATTVSKTGEGYMSAYGALTVAANQNKQAYGFSWKRITPRFPWASGRGQGAL